MAFLKKLFKPAAVPVQKGVKPSFLKEKENPEKSWEVLAEIGDGAFGKVYKTKHRDDGILAALKKEDYASEEELRDLLVEVEILFECKHKNILSMKETYLYENRVWLFLEFCDCGSLGSIMHELEKPLNEAQVRYVARQVCEALVYLHSHMVIHRDLKADNVLVTLNGTVKLADFGVSARLTSEKAKRDSFIGSPFWMAPEVIVCETVKEHPYDSRCDIWSLGVTLIELVQIEPPNHEMHPVRVLTKIVKGDPPTLPNAARFSADFRDFVAACLVKEPAARADSSSLLERAFIRSVGDAQDDRKPLLVLIAELRAEVIETVEDLPPERVPVSTEHSSPSSTLLSAAPLTSGPAATPAPAPAPAPVPATPPTSAPAPTLVPAPASKSTSDAPKPTNTVDLLAMVAKLQSALEATNKPPATATATTATTTTTAATTTTTSATKTVSSPAPASVPTSPTTTVTASVPQTPQAAAKPAETSNSQPATPALDETDSPHTDQTPIRARPMSSYSPSVASVTSTRPVSSIISTSPLAKEPSGSKLAVISVNQNRRSPSPSGYSVNVESAPKPERERVPDEVVNDCGVQIIDDVLLSSDMQPSVISVVVESIGELLADTQRNITELESTTVATRPADAAGGELNGNGDVSRSSTESHKDEATSKQYKTLRRTRKYMVDGVEQTSSTEKVIAITTVDGEKQQEVFTASSTRDFEEYRKQDLRELKLLQRIETRRLQEFSAKRQVERTQMQQRHETEMQNQLNHSEQQREQLERTQRLRYERMQQTQTTDLRSLERQIKNEQQKELQAYRDSNRINLRISRTSAEAECNLLSKDERKTALRLRHEEIDRKFAEQEREFIAKLQRSAEERMERARSQNDSKLRELEREFLAERQAALRQTDTMVADLQERQLADQFAFEQSFIKELFFITCHNLSERHEKELDSLKRFNQQKEESLRQIQLQEKTRLPKLLRTESRTRMLMFRESLRIQNIKNPEEEREKLRQFEEAERNRALKEHQRLDEKHRRQRDELMTRNQVLYRELELIHNEKRCEIVQQQEEKLKELMEAERVEHERLKVAIRDRGQVMKAAFEEDSKKQDGFFQSGHNSFAMLFPPAPGPAISVNVDTTSNNSESAASLRQRAGTADRRNLADFVDASAAHAGAGANANNRVSVFNVSLSKSSSTTFYGSLDKQAVSKLSPHYRLDDKSIRNSQSIHTIFNKPQEP